MLSLSTNCREIKSLSFPVENFPRLFLEVGWFQSKLYSQETSQAVSSPFLFFTFGCHEHFEVLYFLHASRYKLKFTRHDFMDTGTTERRANKTREWIRGTCDSKERKDQRKMQYISLLLRLTQSSISQTMSSEEQVQRHNNSGIKGQDTMRDITRSLRRVVSSSDTEF